jgi:hypothetical protein
MLSDFDFFWILEDLGIDVIELGKKLLVVIPKIIAVNFNINKKDETSFLVEIGDFWK